MGEIKPGGGVPGGDLPSRGDPRLPLERKRKFFEASHNQLLVGNASGNPLYPDISSFVGDVITEFGLLTRIAAGDAAKDPRVTRTRDCLQLLIKASDIRAYGIPPNGKDLAIVVRLGESSHGTPQRDQLLIIKPGGATFFDLSQFKNYENMVDRQSGELLPFSNDQNRAPERVNDDSVIFDGPVAGWSTFTRINPQGDTSSTGKLSPHMTVVAHEALIANPIKKRVDEPWEVEKMRKLDMEPTIKDKLMAFVGRGSAAARASILEVFMEGNEIFKKAITTLCQRFGVEAIKDIPPLEAYDRRFALTGKTFGFGSTSCVLEGEDVVTKEKVAVKFGMMHQALNDGTDPVEPARAHVQEEIENYRRAREAQGRLLAYPSRYQNEDYSVMLSGNGKIGDPNAYVPYILMAPINPSNNGEFLSSSLVDIIKSDKVSLQDKKTAHRMIVYLRGNFLDASARTFGYMQGDAQMRDLIIDPGKRCAKMIDLNVARGDTPYENWIGWCRDWSKGLISSSPSFSREEKDVLKSSGLLPKVEKINEIKEMLVAHRERKAKEGEINDVLLDTLLIDLLTFNEEEKTSKYPPTAEGMIQVAELLHTIATLDIAKPASDT